MLEDALIQAVQGCNLSPCARLAVTDLYNYFASESPSPDILPIAMSAAEQNSQLRPVVMIAIRFLAWFN